MDESATYRPACQLLPPREAAEEGVRMAQHYGAGRCMDRDDDGRPRSLVTTVVVSEEQ